MLAVFLPLLVILGIGAVFLIMWNLGQAGYLKHMFVAFLALFAVGMIILAVSFDAYGFLFGTGVAVIVAIYVCVKC